MLNFDGMPWALTRTFSTTPEAVDFIKVTSAFTVRNLSAGAVKVGFTANGLRGQNYYLVPGNSMERFEIQCKQLYIAGESTVVSASIMAELSNVSARHYPLFSASAITGGGGEWPGVG